VALGGVVVGELKSSGEPLGVAGGACRPGSTGGVREEPGAVGLEGSGKPFEISKMEVWEAHLQVKANEGAPGVDGCSIEEFEKDLRGNLCKVWKGVAAPPGTSSAHEKPLASGAAVSGRGRQRFLLPSMLEY
jgi:hypothetical protein